MEGQHAGCSPIILNVLERIMEGNGIHILTKVQSCCHCAELSWCFTALLRNQVQDI